MLTLTDIILANPRATDAEVLALHNEQLPEGIRTPIQTVRSYISAEFLATPLKRAEAAESLPQQVRDFVSEFRSGLIYAESFDGTDPRIAAAIGLVLPVLVAAEVMTQAQSDGIEAFAVRKVSPATLDDVTAARAALAKAAADRKHLDAKLAADSAGEVAREQGGDYLAAYSSEYTTRMSEGA